MSKNEDIRSLDVQEIMGAIPKWSIRSGLGTVLILIIISIFVTWFIKYPDTVEGKLSISTEKPPIKLVAINSGELQELRITDGDFVHRDQILATIGNSFPEQARIYLDSFCNEVRDKVLLKGTEIQLIHPKIEFGSIHSSYTELVQSLNEYQELIFHNKANLEIQSIEAKLKNGLLLQSVSMKQFSTSQKELELVNEKHVTDRKLYDQGIISKVQLYESERELIRVESNLNNHQKEYVQSKIAVDELKSQLNELRHGLKVNIDKAHNNLLLSLKSVENAIALWNQNFVIKSPLPGRVSFNNTWHKYDHIKAGENVFTVIQESQKYIGYIDTPKSGFGKVKTGQKVRINVDKYPSQEFGQLEGRVSKISLLPNNETYRVEFELINGMVSTHNKRFVYSPEMSGTASIITDDVRLIERIFYNFNTIFK